MMLKSDISNIDFFLIVFVENSWKLLKLLLNIDSLNWKSKFILDFMNFNHKNLDIFISNVLKSLRPQDHLEYFKSSPKTLVDYKMWSSRAKYPYQHEYQITVTKMRFYYWTNLICVYIFSESMRWYEPLFSPEQFFCIYLLYNFFLKNSSSFQQLLIFRKQCVARKKQTFWKPIQNCQTTKKMVSVIISDN